MDLLTQGLIGASLATTAAGETETRRAALIGFASGLLADADALFFSPADPLLVIENHRHFTHSLFFVPVGALIAAALLWPFFRRKTAFKKLYLFSFLGYSLSGFIDACTSYGTHWLWPVWPERISFHIISIVDPVFSLALLAGLLAAIIKKRPRYVAPALLFCAFYLGLGLLQNARAQEQARNLAQVREQEIRRLVVKPTIGNIFLWRSTYMTGDEIYVDAIHVGPFKTRAYPGARVRIFRPEKDLARIEKNTRLYRDVLRFRKFSDGFIGIDKSLPKVLGDMRFSMTPNGTRPLWGITLDPSRPEKPPPYRFYRDFTKEDRRRFTDMLLGR